jgi:hypothetical protein
MRSRCRQAISRVSSDGKNARQRKRTRPALICFPSA